MATQMVSQPNGTNLFCNSVSFGIGDMYSLHDLSKAELAAPRLIMLANVALTGEANNGCCDYVIDEDRQMAELTTVYENSFLDSDGERMELEESSIVSEPSMFYTMEPSEVQDQLCDQQPTNHETGLEAEPEEIETAPFITEDKTKCVKSKPFRCKPCQYKAESEEDFVHHIKDHSIKRFIDQDSNKDAQDSSSCSPEEVDLSKGPIRCDRCGYNTNRFDHYLAHLKHHSKVADNERVYKCTICNYTTVSEYHWKKHLRNHFPRIVYTCSQCSYFSDRKNNYIQHIRTHTGERPYQCLMCPYTSSQKTHLTRHMRTHSGEKPFKCEQCSYVASNQHEVTRHARQVHNGPKPLTCPHCNYKTADRSNFKKHVELHVNPRQFLCPVCNYAASKKCNLQYHIKSRHSSCADITMDVSNVKLRTKKGDVGGSDVKSTEQEEKENADVQGEPPDLFSEVPPIVDKEKYVEVNQVASPPVGPITTRSHKPTSSKTEDDANPDEGKCAKRKSSLVSEKPLKMKKRRLAEKSKHTHDVPRKAIRAKKSEKQKVSIKKNNLKKLVKNKLKKTIGSQKTAISKNKSSKSKKDKDSESIKLQKPKDQNTDVPQTENCLESAPEPKPEEVTAPTTAIEGSDLDAESRTEESTVSDVSVPDLNINLSLSTMEITPESHGLLSEKDSGFNKDEELEPNSVISPVTDEPVLETLSSPDREPLTITSPAEISVSIPEIDCSHEVSGLHCNDSANEELENCNDSASDNSSLEKCEEPEQTKPSDTEQFLSTSVTQNINDCDTKETVHTPCEATNPDTPDIEEDEGIHSHEGSDISDNVSERSDDSGLNGLQSPQETQESQPLLEVPSVSTSVSNESFVCIFCDRVFKKAEEYTKHLKRHLVNVYYLEKAAQDGL
ncbi:RE1-silencing transcription factor [Rhinoderma darwinii]|uniref:RE1-silencing transcription factor n=1 Tax=Rhinoderma darwinii TaxID=43563 RepID=UPI003F66BAC3